MGADYESHSPEERTPGNIRRSRPACIIPRLPFTSDSPQSTPTERQLHIRSHAEDLNARISAMLARETSDTDMLNQNLSAVLRWWLDQYGSDWAVGLTDDPPPMYLDSNLVSFLNQNPPAYLPTETESGGTVM